MPSPFQRSTLGVYSNSNPHISFRTLVTSGFIKGPETEFTTSWSSLTHVWPEKSSSSLFSSVTQSCPTLCNHMDCSTPGLPVHHQLLEFTQTNVHWVGDAIQPSHPLSPPSPPTSNLSQHQGLQMSQFFTSASASALPMNIQDWFPLGLTGWISLQTKELSRVFSNITVQKYQFFGAQLSLWSNSHIHTWLLEKPQLWLDEPLSAK